MSKKPLPLPDMTGTDPNKVLRRRISIGDPAATPDQQPSPTPVHTQVDTEKTRVRENKGGSRPDPDGMRRTSIYITKDAADKLEAGVEQVLEILGEDTPRHVALSALIIAGAEQAPTIAKDLAKQQAAELAARLAALQQASGE